MENNKPLISPSKWQQWYLCPGSLAMQKGLPEKESSDAAKTGTVLHEAAAFFLTNDATYTANNLNAEQLRQVREYVDIVKSYGFEQSYVEKPLDISWLAGEQGATGTPDFIGVKGSELHVFDAKFGHEPVYAHNNIQLIIYAFSAIEKYAPVDVLELSSEILKVYLHIVQPPLNAHERYMLPNNSWEMRELKLDIQAKALESKRIYNDYEGVNKIDCLNAGNHCKTGYCQALPFCPAACDFVTKSCDFEALPMSHDEMQKRYDPAEMSEIYQKLKLIKGWADAVEEFTVEEMQKGVEFPGLKLVRGRGGNRQWSDKEAAAELLKQKRIKSDIAFPRSIATPPQIETAVKNGLIKQKHWNELTELVTQSRGKLTAAPLDDKRDAILPDGMEFEALDELPSDSKPADTPEPKGDGEKAKDDDDDLFNFL